jgi:hypothetical protein
MATLQDLYTTLEQARQGGDLTLTAGSAGAQALDDFLITLPGQSLTLHRPQLTLQGRRQPGTLVVSGAMTGTWPLPGLSAAALNMQAATVTYSQNDPASPVSADLAVTATIAIGTNTATLSGSLGPDSILSFDAQHGGHGGVSLAEAAILMTDGRAQTWVPADVPAFGALQFSSFSVSLGYAPASTTMQFTLDAPPGQRWQILSGQHVLRQIGVTLVSWYRTSAGTGPRHSFSGNVHAILDLGHGIGVIVRLGTGHLWEIELDASAGLPAIETIAAIAGAQDEVRAGLAAIGLGDITLRSVRLGIDRTTFALAFMDIRGSVTIAGKAVDVCLQLPSFTFGGRLSPATPISLTALLESMFGDTGGLPDIQVSALALGADPRTGDYSLLAQVDDGQLTVGGYGLTEVDLELQKLSTAMTGGIGAAVTVAGSELMVTGTYGPGWTVSGELDELSLAALIGEVLADVGLPSPLTSLQLTNVSVSWNLTTGAFSFTGELDMDIQLGPQTLASKLNLSVDSAAGAQSASRTTTAVLTGSLSLGGMTFGLRYAFTPGQQVLTGTWNAQGQAGFADLASAFGIAVPGSEVTLPDLSLTSMSFALDWSKAGEQAVELIAATSIGDAFFVVDRPQPGQPWGFAFGAAIAGATRLSQVLGPAGLDVTALDFITLSGAFFLVASAPFPSLEVPGFAVLAGQPVQVSQGVTAAVLVDLGGTPDRPDVTVLKTLLSGRPPVLLGEVTLSTSVLAIAVTVQLDGSVRITGAGATSVTLTDVSLILKPDPVALTLKGSVEFPLGSTTLLATGLLTVAANQVTGALNVQGENGQVLPIPMGFQGVHLTDIGVEIGVTFEPPSLEMGVLGRFVIGPGDATPHGPVQSRPLTAMPPSDEFVLILGLEGEVPNPLLLSMYLQELSLSEAVEAFTNQQAGLPAVVNDISASDLMIYWCDAPAGLQQPDGTWAYPGYGFNAILDLYGIRAYAELKIDSTSGITGNACIDPLGIPGVIDLTGTGPGTPAAYTGQATVRPGGAQIQVSTIASPYLDISWQLTLFSTLTQTVSAQLTSSGFTFAADASAAGFSSALACAFQTSGHLSMTFSVSLNADADLGTVSGVHVGHVHLADVAAACSLTADASPSLRITIDASFEFDGTGYSMPQISVSTPFSSLPDIPAAILRQIENEGATIFAGFISTAAAYLDVVRQGLITAGDEIGSVLRTGYGLTADQAAAAMKAAGYGITAIGSALISGWGASAGDVAGALASAGYSVSDAGTYLKDTFNLGPDQLHGVLQTAGYAVDQINGFFHSLGGDFATLAGHLDPSKW